MSMMSKPMPQPGLNAQAAQVAAQAAQAGADSCDVVRARRGGKNKGDTVEVTTPKGSRSYEIVKVAWK